jgi:hypothetical protein
LCCSIMKTLLLVAALVALGPSIHASTSELEFRDGASSVTISSTRRPAASPRPGLHQERRRLSSYLRSKPCSKPTSTIRLCHCLPGKVTHSGDQSAIRSAARLLLFAKRRDLPTAGADAGLSTQVTAVKITAQSSAGADCSSDYHERGAQRVRRLQQSPATTASFSNPRPPFQHSMQDRTLLPPATQITATIS